MTKREEIKKIKKSEIHKSALELISENGYYQTSIADIVKKVNISKGLFYHYYSSKDALFEEVVIESFESILNYFPQNKEQEFNDDNLVYFTNKVIILSLVNDKTHWKLLILLLSQQILHEIALKHLTKSTAYIEYENVLNKYFTKKGFEDPDIEVKLFTSSLIGICIQYIINPADYPVKDVMEQFTSRIISKRRIPKKAES